MPTTNDLAHDLTARLTAAGDPAKKDWWERYLKGAIPFLGVPMAKNRMIVNGLWSDHDLETWPTDELIELSHVFMRLEHGEEKLGGVLLLSEHVLDRLGLTHVGALRQPLADGSIADWSTCDWYCVKVLGPTVAGSSRPQRVAEAIASWTEDGPLWQRRAGVVAFVNLVPRQELYPGFHELVVAACARNAEDPTRWSQTSVGWVMRELSKADPDLVRGFLADHPELSTEARKAAAARL